MTDGTGYPAPALVTDRATASARTLTAMNLTQLSDAVEAVSAAYAARWGIRRDDAWFLFKPSHLPPMATAEPGDSAGFAPRS